jgi:hypothetical protein
MVHGGKVMRDEDREELKKGKRMEFCTNSGVLNAEPAEGRGEFKAGIRELPCAVGGFAETGA